MSYENCQDLESKRYTYGSIYFLPSGNIKIGISNLKEDVCLLFLHCNIANIKMRDKWYLYMFI